MLKIQIVKKFLIIVFSILAFLLILFVGLFIIVKSYLTPERATRFAESVITKTLKAETEISRVVPEIGFFNVKIVVKDVRIKKKGEFVLNMGDIEFKIKILPLIFKKKIDIEKIYVKNCEVSYYMKKQELKPGARKEFVKPEIQFLIVLKEFRLENANFLVYENGKRVYDIRNLNLRLSAHSISEKKLNFKGKGSFFIREPELVKERISFSFDSNFDINKDVLYINSYSVTHKNISIKGKGEVKNLLSQEVVYTIEVNSEKFSLSELEDYFGSEVKGNLNVHVVLKGTSKKKLPDIYGEISSDHIVVVRMGKEVSLNDVEVELKGNKGNLKTQVDYGVSKTDVETGFDVDELDLDEVFDLSYFIEENPLDLEEGKELGTQIKKGIKTLKERFGF